MGEMKSIKIVSRASKLALAQTDIVKNSLKGLFAGIEISVLTISTKGDRDKSDFLYKSRSVGFFTSEVESAVLDGRADLAVHSLKDLPTDITPGLIVAAIPERENVADALVASKQVTGLGDLPPHATVGTSSPRRIAQLRHLRDDLKCVALRGNVETRVRKVTTGQIDAIVVACAGLTRLSLTDKISAVLAPKQFLTAPGQGALAVQIREDDAELLDVVSQLDDEPTRIATQAERHVLAAMHGGCSIPLGVYAQIHGDTITIDAMIADIDGKRLIRRSSCGPVSQSKACAQKLAEELLEAGAGEILDQIRNSRDDFNR